MPSNLTKIFKSCVRISTLTWKNTEVASVVLHIGFWKNILNGVALLHVANLAFTGCHVFTLMKQWYQVTCKINYQDHIFLWEKYSFLECIFFFQASIYWSLEEVQLQALDCSLDFHCMCTSMCVCVYVCMRSLWRDVDEGGGEGRLVVSDFINERGNVFIPGLDTPTTSLTNPSRSVCGCVCAWFGPSTGLVWFPAVYL